MEQSQTIDGLKLLNYTCRYNSCLSIVLVGHTVLLHIRLRFGYVTKYGQFVSEAEPDPSHKPGQGYMTIFGSYYVYNYNILGHKIKRKSLSSILGREDHSLVSLLYSVTTGRVDCNIYTHM